MTTLLRLVAVALQALNLFPKLRMYEVKHMSFAVILNAMTQRRLAFVSLGKVLLIAHHWTLYCFCITKDCAAPF